MSKRKRPRSELRAKDHITGYPREHYNADHSLKTPFNSYIQARKVARHLYHRTGEILEGYQCSICGCWHLGHVKESKPDEKYKSLRLISKQSLDIINQYRKDLERKEGELKDLRTKLDNLERLVRENYQELYLYYEPKLKDNETIQH